LGIAEMTFSVIRQIIIEQNGLSCTQPTKQAKIQYALHLLSAPIEDSRQGSSGVCGLLSAISF